ncbi:MAG: hypothetical protein ABEH78_01250 [Haloferacaceae archaeon]
MSPVDASERPSEDPRGHPPIQCDECESTLHGNGNHTVSFLLLDRLTVPLLGCDEHLEQFTSVCGFTTTDAAELLHHRPAGGLGCPSCQFAPYSPSQPVIPVQDGAVAVLACPEHQTELVERFRTGLETRQQITASLDTST